MLILKVSQLQYKYCEIFSDVQTGSTAVLTADSAGPQLRPGGGHAVELLHRRGERGLGRETGGGGWSVPEIRAVPPATSGLQGGRTANLRAEADSQLESGL